MMTDQTILLVDDEKEIRRRYRKYFEKLGLCVIEAENCFIAIEILASLTVETKLVAIFSDYIMPKGPGGYLFQEIHENEKFRNIPFFIFSGYIDDYSIEEIKAFGVGKILEKPVSFKTISDLVKNEILKRVS